MTTQFQTVDEFRDVLGERTLRATRVGEVTKTDRALSMTLIDLDSGELLLVSAGFGALSIHVVGTLPAEQLATARGTTSTE